MFDEAKLMARDIKIGGVKVPVKTMDQAMAWCREFLWPLQANERALSKLSGLNYGDIAEQFTKLKSEIAMGICGAVAAYHSLLTDVGAKLTPAEMAEAFTDLVNVTDPTLVATLVGASRVNQILNQKKAMETGS